MKLRLGVSLVVLSALQAFASPARADLPPDCSGLGQALTEHSCFHVEFGPTTTVIATSGSEPLATTPAIDSVHTEYRVALPNAGGPNVVTYQPQRTGAWTIFLDVPAPLAVVGPDGLMEPRFAVDGNTGCDALTTARIFDLVEGERYTLALGPSSTSEVIVVIEYVDDFITSNGRDADQDGYGDPLDVVETPCLPPAGYAPNALDCDDGDPLVHPGVVETCDGVDENCNSVADDIALPCRVGLGACQATGQWSCPELGELAVCSTEPSPGSDEACNNLDDDCDGAVDEEVACPPDQPACVRSGSLARCGCALDVDCGAAQSGKICDVEAQRCVDGCSDEPGRNGCPSGVPCVVDAATGEGSCGGGAVSSSSVGGAGGAQSSTSAAWGEAGGDGSGGGAGDASSDGCGCVVPATRGSRGGVVGLAAVAVGLSLRRRRRGVLLLLGGCAGAGLVACETSVIQPGDEASTGGAQSSSSSVQSTGAAGGGEGGASACASALGRDPIDHACSHGLNATPIDVLAGATPEGAQDVSRTHIPYFVAFAAGAAGWLELIPTRDGEHGVFTDADVPLRVVSSGGDDLPLVATAWDDSCAAFTDVRVVSLAQGERHLLQIGPSDAPVLLYFEGLETFGDEAWAERCP